MKKNKIIFAALVAVFTILLAIFAVFIIPMRKYSFPLNNDKLNVVIVGDSIFCNEFESDNLGNMLAEKLDANVYNYSIGGTTASRLNWDGEIDYYQDKFNFYNISDIMITGNKTTIYDNARSVLFVSNQAVENTERLAATNLNKCQVLIVSYGVNDYLCNVKATSERKNDEGCFGGAMSKGIAEITKEYPELKIIINAVPYIHVEYANGEVAGTEENIELFNEYNNQIQLIADQYENVYVYDINSYLPVNANNYDEYHVDEIHFNNEAKEIIASSMAELIGGMR